MIRQRVGDRLHWIGGAGDDAVPAYYTMEFAPTHRALPTSRKTFIRLHELASAGLFRGTEKLMNDSSSHSTICGGKRKGYEVSAMKSMMDMAGLVGGPVRPPLVDLKSDEVKALRNHDEHWKPWYNRSSRRKEALTGLLVPPSSGRRTQRCRYKPGRKLSSPLSSL